MKRAMEIKVYAKGMFIGEFHTVGKRLKVTRRNTQIVVE